MARRIQITIAILVASLPALSASQSAISKALELWKPTSITISNGRVLVVTRQRSVTDDIYQAMVAGICMAEIGSPGSLGGISEVAIVNAFSRQGFVFEGGSQECRELNDMPGNKTKLWILGKTHWL
jgi:hypothetical protein